MQVLEMNSPARRTVAAPTDVRLRWRMGPEARGLVLISAVLTAFGLAVLYSSSAFVAIRNSRSGGPSKLDPTSSRSFLRFLSV